MWLLALAIAPGIAISLYIYVKDQYNREPHLNLVLSFIFGMLCSIPAVLIQLALTSSLDMAIPETNFVHSLILAYPIVGLSEEFCKFFVLRYYAFPKKSFDEPFDGIVYGVFIAMGFATLENIGYVFENGVGTAILRMFLSVPAHSSFGILMGYFVGMAKFNLERRSEYLWKGLLTAVFFHGTFDFFLFLQTDAIVTQFVSKGLLVAGAIVSFLIAFRLARRAIRAHNDLSKENNQRMHDDPFS